MTSKPTIIDMLYMPEAADIDIDFEKIEFPIVKPLITDELIEDQNDPAPHKQ